MRATGLVTAERRVGRVSVPPALADCFFLAAVAVLSSVPFVAGLGFHGDDWGYFAEMETASGDSLPDFAAALYEHDVPVRQRPVQLIYVAATYFLFGQSPLGYHLVGLAIIVAISTLLYAVLRELAQPRAVAVAVPLVYALAPNYTGARFWFAAHTAMLSVFFLALGAFASLRALRSSGPAVPVWVAITASAVVASGMAYENTIPVFLVVVAVVITRAASLDGVDVRAVLQSKRTLMVVVANAVGLAAVLAFKAYVTVRIGLNETYAHHLLRVARGSVQSNFGAYGIGLPYVVGWILRNAFSPVASALAVVVGAGTAVYVRALARSESAALLRAARSQLVGGVLTFALGYAIFVVPTLVAFESVGRENRTAVAGTIGVAALYVGLAVVLASLFGRVRQASAFAAIVGAICAAGVLATNTVAQFWVDSFERQEEIVSRLASDVPSLPPRSALVLDGVCLHRRGAYVLTGARDLTGILRLRYGSQQLRAAGIWRSVTVDPRGLHVKAFNSVAFFPYGEDLLIYNFRRRTTEQLTNEERARAYFASRQFRPERDCPETFAWGLEGL